MDTELCFPSLAPDGDAHAKASEAGQGASEGYGCSRSPSTRLDGTKVGPHRLQFLWEPTCTYPVGAIEAYTLSELAVGDLRGASLNHWSLLIGSLDPAGDSRGKNSQEGSTRLRLWRD
jgi:hypothetical protein